MTANEPSRPATLGRAFVLDAGLADLGACGFDAEGLGGAINGGLWSCGAGGRANFGGSGSDPRAPASEPRVGFGGGLRDG